MAAYYPNNVTTDHIQQVLLFKLHWLLFLFLCHPYGTFLHFFAFLFFSNSTWTRTSPWFSRSSKARTLANSPNVPSKNWLFLRKWFWQFYIIVDKVTPTTLGQAFLESGSSSFSIITLLVCGGGRFYRNQNLGFFSKHNNDFCYNFRNQSRLQRNLMYLAAIADSQPQPPTMSGQVHTYTYIYTYIPGYFHNIDTSTCGH